MLASIESFTLRRLAVCASEDDRCSRQQMNQEQQNFRIIGNPESKNKLKHFCAYLYNATIRNPKAARGAQRKVEDAVRSDWSAIGNADDD
jgi:hypothetical protein